MEETGDSAFATPNLLFLQRMRPAGGLGVALERSPWAELSQCPGTWIYPPGQGPLQPTVGDPASALD